MNIFIPSLGTKMVLNEPWTFILHDEYRNYDFWVSLSGEPKRPNTNRYNWSSKWNYGNEAQPIQITLPIGTILSVDRIYIRKGDKQFDSVSFRVLKGSPVPTGRFWAKLDDVNKDLNVTIL